MPSELKLSEFRDSGTWEGRRASTQSTNEFGWYKGLGSLRVTLCSDELEPNLPRDLPSGKKPITTLGLSLSQRQPGLIL